jgi:hypothetical protein
MLIDIKDANVLFFFLPVLEFELRASCLLGRPLALEQCLQPFLVWLFFKQDLILLPRLDWTITSYFLVPAVSGVTGTHHHVQLFPLRWDLTNFFCLG